MELKRMDETTEEVTLGMSPEALRWQVPCGQGWVGKVLEGMRVTQQF